MGFYHFYWFLMGFDWVLLGITGFGYLLLGFTGIDSVLLSFTGHNFVFIDVLLWFTWFYLVSLVFLFSRYWWGVIELSAFCLSFLNTFYWVVTELLKLMGRGNAPWWTSAGSTPPRATRRNWIFFSFFSSLPFNFSLLISFFLTSSFVYFFYVTLQSIIVFFLPPPFYFFFIPIISLSLSLYLASFLFFFGVFSNESCSRLLTT